MRVLAIAELADVWMEAVGAWRRLNGRLAEDAKGVRAPPLGFEYLLYQALVGAWPLEGVDESFVDRMEAYAIKAAREGKVETSWINPDEAHEASLKRFLRRMLDRGESAEFLASFDAFARRTALLGALNSLSQLTLKATMPGIPDFYQGTELWDFSLVDPDNRRPVDFSWRRAALSRLNADADQDLPALLEDLCSHWQDGRIKLYLISRALRVRASCPELFARGRYLPVGARGKESSHVIALARSRGNDWILAAVPRQVARWQSEGAPLGDFPFDDTSLSLPPEAPRSWKDALTGETRAAEGELLPVRRLFQRFPACLLVSESVAARASHKIAAGMKEESTAAGIPAR
jgi:(1->4)-alpha-D-glucan 1-alpha-D-glucosylmutase